MKRQTLMTNQIKKYIMEEAWIGARRRAEKFGGKASQYIGFSLKRAWAMFKKRWEIVKKEANVIKMADWWYDKNTLNIEKDAIAATEVIKESEKALFISFTYVRFNEKKVGNLWVAKSIISR